MNFVFVSLPETVAASIVSYFCRLSHGRGASGQLLSHTHDVFDRKIEVSVHNSEGVVIPAPQPESSNQADFFVSGSRIRVRDDKVRSQKKCQRISVYFRVVNSYTRWG